MSKRLASLAFGLATFPVWLAAQEACSLELIAGGGGTPAGSGGPALEAEILSVSDARFGPDGLLYIADPEQDVVWRVLADQTIEIFAGTGESGSSGDGGLARAAMIDEPRQLAFGPDGSLYVLASAERRIRRIDPEGAIHAFAGDGKGLSSLNLYRSGMTAAELPLAADTDIAVGPGGELYATLPFQHRVIRIDADGTVSPFAGRSTTWREYGDEGDGGPAAEALLDSPADVAVDAAGNVYIADPNNYRIRRVRTDGIIETFAGPDRFELSGLLAVESDSAGRIYLSNASRLRRLGEDGRPEAYLPSTVDTYPNFSVGPDGAIYAGKGGRVVRGDPADGKVVAVAGVGSRGGFGEGGQAVDARFLAVAGIAVSAAGEVYVADSSLHRVRVIRPDGVVERFAGSGEPGFSGDGGPADRAMLNRPVAVAVDAGGRVWIADKLNSRIRRVGPQGVVETIAGNGALYCSSQSTSCGDGGPANQAAVPKPSDIFLASDGAAWILDDNSARTPRAWLRRIAANGTIEAVPPITLDGANPASVIAAALRPEGTLLMFTRDQRLNELLISFDPSMSAEPEPGLTAYLPYSISMAFATDGALYAADGPIIRRVVPGGQTNTLVAPAGATPELQAAIVTPEAFRVVDLAVGANGDLYFTDNFFQRVYRIHEPEACALPARPEIAVQGIRHGATFEGAPARADSLQAAPGEIIAIFGRRLGPAQLAGAQVVDGKLTTSVGGVRVLIDGRPASMIFSSAGQVGAIIPYATPLTDVFESQLQVEVDGVLSEPVGLRVVPSRPGIFTLGSSGAGPGAILNQDGALNTADNPAYRGEVIVLWATGEGQTEPPGVDGLIAEGTLPKPALEVTARVNGSPAEIAYAGAAPGLTAGVMQVNIVVPSDLARFGAVPVSIRVGDSDSQSRQSVTAFIAE